MSYSNVGKVWNTESFVEYLKTIKKPNFAKSVVLHHTGAPSLAMRPNGFKVQHIINIQNYYKSLGWNRGPHLFIDEDQIFGMTPLTISGIHAASFNKNSIGIEVLGNYDYEDPGNGRGLLAWKTAAAASKALAKWLDIPINNNTILFHRDDPKTSKTCPGKCVEKFWVIDLIKNASHPTPELLPFNEPEIGIIEYAVKSGYNYSEAAKLLKIKNGLTYFNNIWIESARYDEDKQTTIALQSELKNDLPRKN